VVRKVTQTADGTTTAEAMFAADEASRSLGVQQLGHGEETAVIRMTGDGAIAGFRGRSRAVTSPTAKESR
jgi:acyl-CoA thioesterase